MSYFCRYMNETVNRSYMARAKRRTSDQTGWPERAVEAARAARAAALASGSADAPN